MKTIRLIYPQWQGGVIADWIPEISDHEVSARGYHLGARLLDFLAPSSGQPVFTVPVSTDIAKRITTNGITDRFCCNKKKTCLLQHVGS